MWPPLPLNHFMKNIPPTILINILNIMAKLPRTIPEIAIALETLISSLLILSKSIMPNTMEAIPNDTTSNFAKGIQDNIIAIIPNIIERVPISLKLFFFLFRSFPTSKLLFLIFNIF